MNAKDQIAYLQAKALSQNDFLHHRKHAMPFTMIMLVFDVYW